MKKLFTGIGALLLSVMCLGVVTSANNDDISTQAIEGGGGEPCYVTGPIIFFQRIMGPALYLQLLPKIQLKFHMLVLT